MYAKHRWCGAAGAALLGASLAAITPVIAPRSGVPMPGVQLTSGDEQITLDIVRSAQDARSGPIITATIPGPPLSETGQKQAQDLADMLAQEGPYAGIYAGQQIRMAETADPLAHALGTDVQLLPGLNEIDAGIYQDLPIASPGGALFSLTSAAWILGFEFVPIPGSHDLNGVAFDERFDDALQTIYDNTVDGTGPRTDVAISADQAITTWAVMNVKNPDFTVLVPLFLDAARRGDLESVLPETGVVEIKGNPQDGWTLVSWNGIPFPQDPGLLTELFVDFRDLIVTPQTAAWNIYLAVLGGDPETIQDAIQTGLITVGEAIAQFPAAVLTDITDEFLPNSASEPAAMLSDALASWF